MSTQDLAVGLTIFSVLLLLAYEIYRKYRRNKERQLLLDEFDTEKKELLALTGPSLILDLVPAALALLVVFSFFRRRRRLKEEETQLRQTIARFEAQCNRNEEKS